MDSRMQKIKELVEYIGCHTDHGVQPEPRPICEKVDEALALLTADPEPCEDAIALAGHVRGCNHDSAECEMIPFDDAVALIESYASRLAQKARADERRRCVNEAISMAMRKMGHSRIALEEYATILQGTEPAKHYDSEDKHGTYDNPVDAKPAKVSEGVEAFRCNWCHKTFTMEKPHNVLLVSGIIDEGPYCEECADVLQSNEDRLL